MPFARAQVVVSFLDDVAVGFSAEGQQRRSTPSDAAAPATVRKSTAQVPLAHVFDALPHCAWYLPADQAPPYYNQKTTQ